MCAVEKSIVFFLSCISLRSSGQMHKFPAVSSDDDHLGCFNLESTGEDGELYNGNLQVLWLQMIQLDGTRCAANANPNVMDFDWCCSRCICPPWPCGIKMIAYIWEFLFKDFYKSSLKFGYGFWKTTIWSFYASKSINPSHITSRFMRYLPRPR